MPKLSFDYAGAVRELRKYANGFEAADGYNLHHPLSKSRRERVKRYMRALHIMTNRPNQLIRVRNPERERILKRAAGNLFGYDFKFIFYPVQGGERIDEIVWRRNTPIIKYKRDDIYRVVIPITDPIAFANDPVGELKKLMERAPGASYYKIMFGANESRDVFRYGFWNEAKFYFDQLLYGHSSAIGRFGDFATGIVAYDLPENVGIGQFVVRQQKEVKEYRQERKLERQRKARARKRALKDKFRGH